MITQSVLDFFRDVVANWISGISSLTSGVDIGGAASAIGSVASQAGHFLALFIAGSVWPAIISAWGVWILVWLTTGAIAIISRRGASA